MSIFDKQAAFLSAGDVQFPADDIKGDGLNLAISLIVEEFDEWKAEYPGTPNDFKECIDLIYVCAQYMNQAVGPDVAQQLFDAVHADNMNKCVDGKLRKGPSGKILKPDGYEKLWKPKFDKILGEL